MTSLFTPELIIYDTGLISGRVIKLDQYGGFALGYDASLIGSTASIAIGNAALFYAEQDGPDIAIGANALNQDAGTGLNIAIGSQAMSYAQPQHGFDIAIGTRALQVDKGYGYNIGIGNEAIGIGRPLYGFDTAIGGSALNGDEDGYNTAVGFESLSSSKNGIYNTAIGYRSSCYTNGLSNTVAIGAFATPGASNVAVFAPFVNVGINTNLPTSTLQVTGNIYASNALTTTNVYASGNIAAAYFTGDGSALSEIQSANISQPFSNLVVSNSLTTTNVFTDLLQLVSSSIYSSVIAQNFSDSPYTTALSSDGTTLVLGYIDRISIYDIASRTTRTDNHHGGSWSVSINSDATILVSGDPDNGVVNIYEKSLGGWKYITSIGPGPGTGNFGYSVSISGSTFLVSDATPSTAVEGTWGTAYKFYRGDGVWLTDKTFTPPTANISSVALSGDGGTCVFGAPGTNDITGSIYITKDNGKTYTSLYGDNRDDYFGYYVSVNYDGTRIVANSSNRGEEKNYIKIFTLE